MLGWRRVPYIWFGTLLQFGGLAIMPFALLILSGDTTGPVWPGHVAAALALVGADGGIVGGVGRDLHDADPVRDLGQVAQHALGRAVQGFVEAHEAAGQRPAAGMGMLGPLHQEHGRTARAQPHQDEIDGDADDSYRYLIMPVRFAS